MTHRSTSLVTRLFLPATLVTLALACTPDKGFHPHTHGPENHAAIHKPQYLGGEIDPGELQPVDPQANIERADPPAWSEGDERPPLVVTAVVLDRGITEVCEIEQTEAYFDYDSAKLDKKTKRMLDALAACLDDGPLTGHDIEVVGYTDPRGTDAYNRELGESRAESVTRTLVESGLPRQRIETQSRGEELAHEDPDKWPTDRRVEIRLNS